MITKIFAIDREGNNVEYVVSQEPLHEGNFSGIRFMVTRPELGFKFFEVGVLHISADRVMIFMLLNHYHPELTGKGIVKAMLQALSNEFKKDIVSSTNKENLKISISEGRICEITKAWKKWMSEFPNIEYLESEDRFVFHYRP